MHTKFKQFLHSFVAVPVLAATLVNPVPSLIAKSPIAAAISSDKTGLLVFATADNQQSDPEFKAQVAKVEAYFARHDLPLGQYSEKLVSAAREKGFHYATFAAMGMIESTGMAVDKYGKPKTCAQRTRNPFGYGSCKITFDSVEDAIDTVAETLAGEREATSRFYDGKTFEQRLRVYNGYGADLGYIPKIKNVMKHIDSMEIDPVIHIASI